MCNIQPTLRFPSDLMPSCSPAQTSSVDEDVAVIGVVAPLNYVGPYACLELVFPHLQQTGDEKDDAVSINFVLDTGANVNSISKELAMKLDLPVVVRKEDLDILGSAGAGGSFQAGNIVLLGDCKLGGMPPDQQNVKFMKNLTAEALDLGIATAVADGLLGISFFQSFQEGVEFDWFGTQGDPPTVQFWRMLPEYAKQNTFSVPIESSFFGVPCISVQVNGVEMTAIIDTGSPISILSPIAAEEIDIGNQKGAKRTDVKIKGIDDEIVGLSRPLEDVSIAIGELTFNKVATACVGDLSGLSMASNLSTTTVPKMLIGLDVLRRMYRMILRPKDILFEELPRKFKRG